MKKIPVLLISTMLAAGTSFATPAFAQSSPPGSAAARVESAAMTLGEVRKIDKDAGKITLRHEAIKNLGMPPMTMVFQAKDPAILDQVKPGDKVRFAAASESGRLIVTQIELAK